MSKRAKETRSSYYFNLVALAVVAIMYMFAFHNERNKNIELLYKYELLKSACKAVKEPVYD